MKMTLEEIADGVTKKIKVNKLVNADGVTYKTCSTCNGSGRIMRVAQTFLGAMQTQSTCHACQGAGKMIDKRPSVDIPIQTVPTGLSIVPPSGPATPEVEIHISTPNFFLPFAAI